MDAMWIALYNAQRWHQYRDYDTQNNDGDGILHSDTVTQDRISQGRQNVAGTRQNHHFHTKERTV